MTFGVLIFGCIRFSVKKSIDGYTALADFTKSDGNGDTMKSLVKN